MKTLTLILMACSLTAFANTVSLELLSDSEMASGHHRLHILNSQIKRVLSCQHKSADFEDTEPDVTQVLLDLDDVTASNITMRGHYPRIFSEVVDTELCDKVELIRETLGPNDKVEYSFQLFLGTRENGRQFLEERVTVKFPHDLVLTSVKQKALFQ